MNTYLFQLSGAIDVGELNAMSPHQMTTLPSGLNETRFSIATDQSGMIGMLQHLHNLGLAVQSITSQPPRAEPPEAPQNNHKRLARKEK